MPKLVIDGIEVLAPEGINLVEAGKLVGIKIPTFCYHPALSIVGQCRICLVEVEGIPKLQPACATFVRDGMVVHTNTERVKKIRAQVMEFLLINHPLDCPICDQAGECDLQDFCEEYSFKNSRFLEEKRVYKNEERRAIGPYVFQNQNRCIHCSRCIRFCEEISETGELTFAKRGHKMLVDLYPSTELSNPWSLCTADICPVGALTSRDFRFKERVWNLESKESICPHCGIGCNIYLQHKSGVIKRILPRLNEEINNYWLCDKGRLSYKWMNEMEYFDFIVDGKIANYENAIEKFIEIFQRGKLSVIINPFLTIEEIYLMKERFSKIYILKPSEEERKIKSKSGWIKSNNLAPNCKGAEILKIPYYNGEKLEDVFLIAHPLIKIPNINGNVKIIDTRHKTIYDAQAELIIPSALFLEKEGTYLSESGFLQHFPKAFNSPQNLPSTFDYLLDFFKKIKPFDFDKIEECFLKIGISEGKGYNQMPLRLKNI